MYNKTQDQSILLLLFGQFVLLELRQNCTYDISNAININKLLKIHIFAPFLRKWTSIFTRHDSMKSSREMYR